MTTSHIQKVQLAIETLKERTVPTACVTDYGKLRIEQTDSDDIAHVSVGENNTIEVTDNGQVSVFSRDQITSGRIRYYGNAGNDLFHNHTDLQAQASGGAGDDLLLGGNNRDWLSGGDGKDQLDGGDSSDFLVGGGNDDTLDGGAGNDTLWGDYVPNLLPIGPQQPLVRESSGDDVIRGGDGDDTIYGGLGEDWLDGGIGGDLLFGYHTKEHLLVNGHYVSPIYSYPLEPDGNDVLDPGVIGEQEKTLRLAGAAKPDVLNGGDGSDLFVSTNEPGVEVDDFNWYESDRVTQRDSDQYQSSYNLRVDLYNAQVYWDGLADYYYGRDWDLYWQAISYYQAIANDVPPI